MFLKIDFDSEEPIYQQIKNEIIKGIARGELLPGDELPSVRAMAEEIGVNMHTVNKAYTFLRDAGYIKIDRRKGAIISLSLEDSNNKFINNSNNELDLLVAECFNRKISKEDIINEIEKLYKKYEDLNEREGI